jgi:hypothetical protein
MNAIGTGRTALGECNEVNNIDIIRRKVRSSPRV